VPFAERQIYSNEITLVKDVYGKIKVVQMAPKSLADDVM
jgi:hypothetical protein